MKSLRIKIAQTIASHQWEDFEGSNPYSSDDLRLAGKILRVLESHRRQIVEKKVEKMFRKRSEAK